jgi:hypothetical protein
MTDNRRTSALEQPHPELCVWPACEYWDKIERCPCVTGKPDPSSDNRRTSALSERESGTAGESPRDPRTVSAAPRSESDNRRTGALRVGVALRLAWAIVGACVGLLLGWWMA